MQKVYLIFFLFISQLISVELFAQRIVYGTVVDSLGQSLKSVNVRLIADNDTVSVATGVEGEFEFHNITHNYFVLTYSMLGYKTESNFYFFLDGVQKLKLPVKTLKPSYNLLPAVPVVKVVPVLLKGDTIQFNFDAYRFQDNMYLEEALKDLPGFQVYRDGSVTYNGNQIRRVRVDNKDFFGGDLLTATRNLPAEFIKNIQLINSYNTENGNTALLNENDEKILNISLKEDRKRIYFGQGTLGLGAVDKYMGNFSMNKFDKGQELSMLGSFNNTNTNIFSFGNPFDSDEQTSRLDGGLFDDPIDGLNRVGSLGVSLSDQISEVVSFSGSYNYINNKNLTIGSSQLTSSYIGNTIFRKEDYSIDTDYKIHRAKFGFNMNFKNKDVFKINGNLSFAQQSTTQNSEFNFNNSRSLSTGSYQDTSRNTSPNIDLDLYYSKYLDKKGRKLYANLLLNSNNNNRSNFINEKYTEGLNSNDIINPDDIKKQFITQRNHTSDAKFMIAFLEPISSFSRIEFSYDYEFTTIDAFRQVENRLTVPEYFLIDSLSVDYIYSYSSHKGNLVYQFEPNNKLKVNVGFAVQPLIMRGDLPLKSVYYKYDNVNLIPAINLVYKFSSGMDWQLNYKGKNNQPNFNQIAPVIDNTNSRNIIIGNPELKSEYSHRISSAFRKSWPSNMQYFEANIAYNFVLDKIVSSKRTLPSSTIQETRYQNTSGYYDWRFYYTFNTPAFSENVNLDLTGTADYFNNLSYIDNRKRTTNQLLINQSLQVKYQLNDYIESMVHANYIWNQARYDIPFKTKIDVKSTFVGIGLKAYHNSFTLGMDISQRFNDGYKNNLLNVNQTLMNSYIQYTFLKNKSAFLRLQVNDLFGQNQKSGIISEYIGNDVYEAKNNRLGRYIMLSLNIRLQKLPK